MCNNHFVPHTTLLTERPPFIEEVVRPARIMHGVQISMEAKTNCEKECPIIAQNSTHLTTAHHEYALIWTLLLYKCSVQYFCGLGYNLNWYVMIEKQCMYFLF